MKKALLSALTLAIAFAASAQTVRTNYRANGITHISTEYETLSVGSEKLFTRVELAGFPDGSTLYLLYLNMEQKTGTVVPKGVKMAVTLNSGKILRLEQIGEDSATKPRLDNGMFLNRLKYAVETADMEKMIKGVKSVDIITGWNPEDYLQLSFPKDQLGDLLKRHCTCILKASEHTIDLEATLGSFTENLNSILSAANPIVARGSNFDYNVLLSHLYYKNNNEEDMDLAFVLGSDKQYHVPYDALVRFKLNDGTSLDLQQTRDDMNFVYVYPSLEQLQQMVNIGIQGISIDYEGGTLEDSFGPREDGARGFSEAVNQELQLLLSLSPR